MLVLIVDRWATSRKGAPKKYEPFKLPGAGTVDEFEGGFVPAEYKKQRGVR